MPLQAIEYRKNVRGFGTWRIGYDAAARKWRLACNVSDKRERWEPAGDFEIAETAALAVADRQTGVGYWDILGFGRELSYDLSAWKSDTSEGVQADANEVGC